MSLTSALCKAIDTIPPNNIQSTVKKTTIGARTILSQSNEPIVSTHSRLTPTIGKHDIVETTCNAFCASPTLCSDDYKLKELPTLKEFNLAGRLKLFILMARDVEPES